MVAVDAAGIDTWSPAWYVEPDSHLDRVLRELAIVPMARGKLMPEPIAEHRVGYYPSAGLMWAEGHPEPGALAAPDGLPGVLDDLVAELDARGLPAPRGVSWDAWVPGGEARFAGFAGVRRLDATVNLATETMAEGVAILAGVAAIARVAASTATELHYGTAGGLQTVYFLGAGGKRKLGRWYDKGIEALLAPRGRVIRAEDQRRFVKGTRRDVEELTSGYVREKFAQRFRPLWQACGEVTVGGETIIGARLAELVQAGDVTAAEAERMLGYIGCERHGIPARSRRTGFRRRDRLRRLGLVLADDVLDTEVSIDLAAVMEQVLESDAWGHVG
jgi:hypothetical protein